jgi:hypothetical protein
MRKLLALLGLATALVFAAAPAAQATTGVHGYTHDCAGITANTDRVDICIDLYTDDRSDTLLFKVEVEFICSSQSPTGATVYQRCDGVTSSFYESQSNRGSTALTRPLCGVYGGSACDFPRTLSYGTSWFADDYLFCRWQGHTNTTTIYFASRKWVQAASSGQVVTWPHAGCYGP